MSIRKTLLMLTVNYILVFAWMFWFRLGEVSALIIFPICMGVVFFNTVMADGRMSAYLWCGNLLIANIAGILLQAFLYIRETGDTARAMLRAAVEVPAAVLIIGLSAVISGHEASKLKMKRKARPSVEKAPGSLQTDGEEDDEDEEELRGGFRSSMGLFGDMDHRNPEEDDDIDDGFDEEEASLEYEEEEPKFRVIKKS